MLWPEGRPPDARRLPLPPGPPPPRALPRSSGILEARQPRWQARLPPLRGSSNSRFPCQPRAGMLERAISPRGVRRLLAGGRRQGAEQGPEQAYPGPAPWRRDRGHSRLTPPFYDVAPRTRLSALEHLVARERSCEVIALGEIAAQLPELLELLDGLYTFCSGLKPECVGKEIMASTIVVSLGSSPRPFTKD